MIGSVKWRVGGFGYSLCCIAKMRVRTKPKLKMTMNKTPKINRVPQVNVALLQNIGWMIPSLNFDMLDSLFD